MPRLKTSSVAGTEWWRKKYERALWHKWALECLVSSQYGWGVMIEGSDRYPIVVKGNWIYKVRRHGRLNFPGEPVGRFHGKALVLHKKLAPKWLRTWAGRTDHVYLLDALDKPTLAAHLMKEKLLDAADR